MQVGGAYSPINAYGLGIASVGLGIHALVRPREEYRRFGLPLESSARTTTTTTTTRTTTNAPDKKQVPASPEDEKSDSEGVSPLILIKSSREISYGLALIGLQYEGNAAGVTIIAAVMALAAFGDGFLVWARGGKKLKDKAWGHLAAGLGLGCWAGWRAFRAYGEWAAFHALHY